MHSSALIVNSRVNNNLQQRKKAPAVANNKNHEGCFSTASLHHAYKPGPVGVVDRVVFSESCHATGNRERGTGQRVARKANKDGHSPDQYGRTPRLPQNRVQMLVKKPMKVVRDHSSKDRSHRQQAACPKYVAYCRISKRSPSIQYSII